MDHLLRIQQQQTTTIETTMTRMISPATIPMMAAIDIEAFLTAL